MSAYKKFTCADFNDSFDKHKGECIVFDPEKARSLEPKKGSEQKYDVTYLSLQFKDVDGKVHDYPKFTFTAFTGGRARPPHGTNPEQVKHVNISFRKMTYDDISGGDYVPKKLIISDADKDSILSKYLSFQSGEIKLDSVKKWLKSTLEYRPSMSAILRKIDSETSTDQFRKWLDDHAKNMIESQKAEDADMAKWIKKYNELTLLFIKTLDNMDKAFKLACKRLIEMGDNDELTFDVQKDGSDRPPKIGTIVQREKVEGKGKNKKIHKFDNPIYRVKLGVHKKDGRVGYINYKSQEFYPTVFDMRKSTKKNGWAAIPARVFEKNRKGKLEGKTLTWRNVDKFITYKSLLAGTLAIKEATMSKSGGISSKFEISRVNVLRHKPSNKSSVVDAKVAQDMRRGDCSSDEEDEDMGGDEVEATVDEDTAADAYEQDMPDAGDASSEGEDPSED